MRAEDGQEVHGEVDGSKVGVPVGDRAPDHDVDDEHDVTDDEGDRRTADALQHELHDVIADAHAVPDARRGAQHPRVVEQLQYYQGEHGELQSTNEQAGTDVDEVAHHVLHALHANPQAVLVHNGEDQVDAHLRNGDDANQDAHNFQPPVVARRLRPAQPCLFCYVVKTVFAVFYTSFNMLSTL